MKPSSPVDLVIVSRLDDQGEGIEVSSRGGYCIRIMNESNLDRRTAIKGRGAVSNGKDYDSRSGARMRGCDAYADTIAQRFALSCKRQGLAPREYRFDCNAFTSPRRSGDQVDKS